MEKRKLGVENLNWKKFQKVFLERYFSKSLCKQQEQNFIFLRQGEKTVTQYEAEFHRLLRFALDLLVTEEARAKRFLNGLKLTI